MKKSLTIITLSIISILILIGIEVLLVTRIHSLSTEKFNYRYRDLVRSGLVQIGNRGLNEMYQRLDKYTPEYILLLQKAQVDTLEFRQKILIDYQKTLVKYQRLDERLKVFFEKIGEDPGFKSYFRITGLVFFDGHSSFSIYDQAEDTGWGYGKKLLIPSGLKPVNSYQYAGDYFELTFDYFVDYSKKKEIVLQQIAGSLLLAVLALVAVGIMFIYSLKNLLEERRLSQLKTDFINNMTHELKTPLSTISIATRTLENDSVLDDRKKTRDTVSVIHRQNRQLTKQINHLLEISMWERKQFSLERREIEVESFFAGIAEAFRWECKESHCTVEEKYSIKTPNAYLDEVQMTIALHNLFVNAVKYNSGDPHILLEVICDDRLRIVVTDNGIGISREDQKHVFDKFYRVHTGNIHKIKGLGLGLFYVREIVKAHGGSIEVSSRPGKGSTFTINLPVHGKN